MSALGASMVVLEGGRFTSRVRRCSPSVSVRQAHECWSPNQRPSMPSAVAVRGQSVAARLPALRPALKAAIVNRLALRFVVALIAPAASGIMPSD